MSARELFWAYRAGWRDAAASKAESLKYTKHLTRPDLVEAYERGYGDGRIDVVAAMNREMKRVGYVPNPLRDSP